jgi:hypothetical protein
MRSLHWNWFHSLGTSDQLCSHSLGRSAGLVTHPDFIEEDTHEAVSHILTETPHELSDRSSTDSLLFQSQDKETHIFHTTNMLTIKT